MSFSMRSSNITQFGNIYTSPSFNAAMLRYVRIDPNLSLDIQPNDVLVFNGNNFQLEAEPAVPAGSIFPYAGSTAPNYYLLCDGSAVSRNTYSTLFAIIGTTYGVGDGSTTFNLPDLRGNIPVGKDAVTFNTLGGVGGVETVTLNINQIPSHNHGGSTVINQTGITNNSNTTGVSNNSNTTSVSNNSNTTGVTTQNAGEHTHSSNAVGGQGNYGLCIADGTNTVINTDSSSGELNVWTVPGALSINNSGIHTHTITDPGHTHTITDPGHNHTITDPGHTHTITDPGHVHIINSQGGSQPHTNLQPYLVVNYIIKT